MNREALEVLNKAGTDTVTVIFRKTDGRTRQVTGQVEGAMSADYVVIKEQRGFRLVYLNSIQAVHVAPEQLGKASD